MTVDATPLLALPMIMHFQAEKHLTHNEAPAGGPGRNPSNGALLNGQPAHLRDTTAAR